MEKIEVVEMDFSTACLFFKSDSDAEFREEIRKLLSLIDMKKASILSEELTGSYLWPKCALVDYKCDESEACYI